MFVYVLGIVAAGVSVQAYAAFLLAVQAMVMRSQPRSAPVPE
jgi:hypothetical protein